MIFFYVDVYKYTISNKMSPHPQVTLAAVLAVAATAVTSPGFRGFPYASVSSSAFARPAVTSRNYAAYPVAPIPGKSVAAPRVASPDAAADIVRYENDVGLDGSYHY